MAFDHADGGAGDLRHLRDAVREHVPYARGADCGSVPRMKACTTTAVIFPGRLPPDAGILGKLRIAGSPDDHRRVLAVLAYLGS